MMVLGVQSKRQRRPNVRLGEIGGISAAISCGDSSKHKENHELKNPKYQQKNLKERYLHKGSGCFLGKFNFTVSDPGVSSKLDAQNWENKNPNSVDSVSELTALGTDVDNANLDFGKVTRKSRVMKRMRDNFTIGIAWNSRLSSETAIDGDKGDDDNVVGEPASNPVYDICTIEGLKQPLEGETSQLIKPTFGNELALEDPISDMNGMSDSDEFWTGNACEVRNFNLDDAHDFVSKFGKEKNVFHSDDVHDFDEKNVEERNGFQLEDVCNIDKQIGERNGPKNVVAFVHDVGEWLEEMGFGRYARIFELHEVDEEVLPLLTFDDLKEMGIDAVGTRRKLFTAIQCLKDGCGPAQCNSAP